MAYQDEYDYGWQDFAPVSGMDLPIDWGSWYQSQDPYMSFDNPWSYQPLQLPDMPEIPTWQPEDDWMSMFAAPQTPVMPEMPAMPWMPGEEGMEPSTLPQFWQSAFPAAEPETGFGFSNIPREYTPPASIGLGIAQPGGPSIDEQLKQATLQNLKRSQGIYGTGLGVKDLIGIGGNLFSQFGPQPSRKVTDLERAEAELKRAQAESLRNPRPTGGGGGGGGGQGPLRPGGMANVEAILQRMGLGGAGDLFNQYRGQYDTKASAITGAEPAQFQQRVNQVVQMMKAQEAQQFAQQRAQARETAIKEGINPAAAEAEIVRMEMLREQQRPVEAQQQVQQMQSAEQQLQLSQLEPYLRMLELINPQQYLSVLGQLFATPAPG